jgi:hypothetical protein
LDSINRGEKMSKFDELRADYHKNIRRDIIRLVPKVNALVDYYNMADGSNVSSVEISRKIVDQLPYPYGLNNVAGQTSGDLFEKYTLIFVESAFNLLSKIRPGSWQYSTSQTEISGFDQYEHLAELSKFVHENKALASIIGTEYIIKPDIIIARKPVDDNEINDNDEIITRNLGNYSPLLSRNKENPSPILHASISCKWTIRSDRSQNTRTEALNLIRNRKGNLPHIVAVTAEPLPTRIATLALGTGDLDCVYHFALYELRKAIIETNKQDQLDILNTMIEGRRLRDISDLPLDMAI